jgi:CheY-like chemotaxis protein
MFLHDIRAPLGGAQAWVRAIYRQLERYPSHEWITRSRAAIDRDFAEAFSVIEQFDQFFRPVGAPTKLHQAFQALRNSTAIRLQAESIENPYSALTTVDENGADEKHGRLDHVVTPWNALPHPDALDRNGASATPSGKILVVDDARSFLDTYRTMLAPEGYELEGVTDGPSALAKLEQPGWDLVLLDRKLQGRFGPDTGLDLIQAIRERAPGAKIIIVTGVADAESVERAFAVGAYDYLEKTSYLEAILKVKVRNAMEAARERRMAALANGKREEALRELWSGVRTERDPHRKGKLLEDLVALLFKSIPGFERTETDLKSIDEQIDILIPNESTDPLWQREQSPYFLGECKHWSKPVGPAELDRFRNDIKRRYGRCRLGFFIAIGGFTSGFHSTLAAAREGDALIIAIDAEQLQSLVEATNRNAKLKELHARATMGKV